MTRQMDALYHQMYQALARQDCAVLCPGSPTDTPLLHRPALAGFKSLVVSGQLTGLVVAEMRNSKTNARCRKWAWDLPLWQAAVEAKDQEPVTSLYDAAVRQATHVTGSGGLSLHVPLALWEGVSPDQVHTKSMDAWDVGHVRSEPDGSETVIAVNLTGTLPFTMFRWAPTGTAPPPAAAQLPPPCPSAS